MSNVQICLDCRKLDTFPYDQIKKLDALYFRPVWGPRQWLLLESPHRQFFCLWTEREIEEGQVEVTSFLLGELNAIEESFEIFKVITIPRFRRQNVATKLFEELCGILIKQGIKRIFLQVASDNIPALQAYSSWGFLKSRVIKNYYSGALDAQELVLSL